MINALVRKLGLDKLGEVLETEARRLQIEVLHEEREVLARMIAKLDERIAGLGGKRRGRPPKAAIAAAPPPATRKPRRRKARITPKPGETLKDFVVKALAKAGGLVKVTTLVDLVLQAGYKTNAKRSTLVTSTYTVLTDKKLFRKMGKGVFGLVAAPTPPRKTAMRKKRAKAISRKPGETLQLFVLRAFRKSRGPMKANHLVKRVLQLGYQTTSTPQNLLFSVHHVLADESLFRRVGKGLYALALPGSTKRKVGRPRKRAKVGANKSLAVAAKEQKAEVPANRDPQPLDAPEAVSLE